MWQICKCWTLAEKLKGHSLGKRQKKKKNRKTTLTFSQIEIMPTPRKSSTSLHVLVLRGKEWKYFAFESSWFYISIHFCFDSYTGEYFLLIMLSNQNTLECWPYWSGWKTMSWKRIIPCGPESSTSLVAQLTYLVVGMDNMTRSQIWEEDNVVIN